MNFVNFGEVLFDIFPDKEKLGGAPLNVAAHLTKFGMKGITVSAVGKDKLGERAVKEIESIGLSTEGIARIDKETGKAFITMKGNDADYTFNEDNAWDNIPLPKLPEETDVLYFGSLAQRAAKSRETLQSILSRVKSKMVFFDVNIRKNYYSREILEESLSKANILKLNDEEIDTVLSNLPIRNSGMDGLEELKEKYGLDLILLTLGKDGSMCYRNKWHKVVPEPTTVVDTVGAGDSLSAGFIYTYLKTNDVDEALSFGSKVASIVVAHRGAIPDYDVKALGL